MTDDAFPQYTAEEALQRLTAATAETLRKKAERRQERRQFDARRKAGLEARHRAKLAGQEAAQIEPANQEADT
jgi:hypothetical protein